MTRIAIFGDLHLSERSPRYAHALDVLRRAVQDAREQEARHFFFLGDIFEGTPSPREYGDFISVLLELTGGGGLVGIVRGNHCHYEALSFFEALSPVICVAWDDIRLRRLSDDLGILMIPYPTRQRTPYQQLEDGGTILGSMRAAAARIAGWVEVAAQEPRALVVLGHFTIEGMGTRDTEFELHQANEVVVPVTAFSPAALTVVGHIHREQEITPTVIGAGSMYRCSFSEAEDPKGYVLVTAAGGVVRWERRRVGARPMMVYAIELNDITSEWVYGVAGAAKANAAEVKITVSMDEEQAPRYSATLFDPIDAAAPLLVIERVVRPKQRVRAPQMSVAMDPSDQLAAWLQATEQPLDLEILTRLTQKLQEVAT